MKTKRKTESDQISVVLARFTARKDRTDAADLGEQQPTERERRQVQQLLDAGYSVEQLLGAVDQAFHSRPPHAKPIRSFGFVLSYVHRRLRPTGHPPTLDGATEGVLPVADAEQTPQTTSDPIPADPLERVYGLLDAASVDAVEDGDNVLHNTPGVRLGLRGLVGGPDACSSDEVYDAVLAALSRNVHPNRLVGYVTSVLGNARAEAREQERLLAPSSEPSDPASGETEPPSRRSPPLALDDCLPQPDEEACKMWEAALAELELQMTGVTFDAWIRPTSLLSWESESNGSGNPRAHIVVGAPNGYIRDWLENRLVTPIQRTLTCVAGNAVEVRFEICEQGEGQPLAMLGVTAG